jgi:hypothetical protein
MARFAAFRGREYMSASSVGRVLTAAWARLFAVVAVLVWAVALVPAVAFASDDLGWYLGAGIGYTDVFLKTGENPVARGTTDKDGNVSFPGLAPGHYTLVIDGKSLVASLAPKKKSHSSFSIGVGGMFGGGHSGSGHSGAGSGHGGSGGGGGVGLGVSIPVGGGDDDSGKPGHPTVVLGLLLPAVQSVREASRIKIAVPVDPDAPGDFYFSFDVQTGGTVRVQLAIGTQVISGDAEGRVARTSNKNETWISPVGDDANPCRRAAPCRMTGDATPRGEAFETSGHYDVNGHSGDAGPDDRKGLKGFHADLPGGWAEAGLSVSIIDSSGHTVARATTGAKGTAVFRSLAPGHYTLVIDGKSLAAAIEKAGRLPGEKMASPNAKISLVVKIGELRVATSKGSMRGEPTANWWIERRPAFDRRGHDDFRVVFDVPDGAGPSNDTVFVGVVVKY